jgi:hypothetical protein
MPAMRAKPNPSAAISMQSNSAPILRPILMSSANIAMILGEYCDDAGDDYGGNEQIVEHGNLPSCLQC